MIHCSTNPVDLCERLQAVRRELRSLAHEYRALDEGDLDVDGLGEPVGPGDVLTSVCGGLIVARNVLDTAAEGASRLRER